MKVLKLISNSHFKSFKFLRSVTGSRLIFSSSGVWDSELTNNVKKEIEDYWKEKVNLPYPTKKDAKYFYLLSMFPYPSGKLHMGHVRVYTISDAIARFLRMNGYQVIHPIGWDAFGLPAENAAIERNTHPLEWTTKNISAMKEQLKELNISFDWDKEISTCDASYYKWTQYIFLLLFEQGLAYKKKALVNWDPVDQTVLADEQVDEKGCSWRSGCKVEKRHLSQWFLRTSTFSKNLYDGLSDPSLIEWRDAIKIQKHWIGEPDGVIIHFKIVHQDKLLRDSLTVWTNSVELLFGTSFIAVSSNHQFNCPEYGGGNNSDSQLNIYAVHPLTGSHLPIFVTDVFSHSSATDSTLGIPHTTFPNQLEFAQKHNLKILNVVDDSTDLLINSGEFSGVSKELAKDKILQKLKDNGTNVYQASKRLKDWLISRQRYWGTPIPIINCPTCHAVPVDKKNLPVYLPKLEEFSGKSSSLRNAEEWVKVNCPKCGGPAERETDTMDTFVDSSWYFLRYLDVENEAEPYETEKINSLMPVDLYIGGKEHAGLHMFYARFLGHFLHSIGKLKNPEPFQQLLMQGMVMGKSYRLKESKKYIPKSEVDFSGPNAVEKCSGTPIVVDWEKMSKSKHNGIDPQEVMNEYGIDTTRLFILGSVVPQSPRKWNEELFPGIKNWQWRLWLTVSDFLEQRKLNNIQDIIPKEDILKYEALLNDDRNYYVKGITHNFITTRQLSIAIAKLQGLTGSLRRLPKEMAQTETYSNVLAALIIMLAPVAPHFACELWTGFCSAAFENKLCYDLHAPVLHQKWPVMDKDCKMLILIKANGEECDSISISRPDLLALPPEKAIEMSLSRQKVIDTLGGAKVKNARYKPWPNYDSEVHIVFAPIGKKAKKKLAVNS